MGAHPRDSFPTPPRREPDTPGNTLDDIHPGEGLGETPLPLPSSRGGTRRRWSTDELQHAPGWRCLDCPTVVRGGEGALREASWIIHHDRNPTHQREVLR